MRRRRGRRSLGTTRQIFYIKRDNSGGCTLCEELDIEKINSSPELTGKNLGDQFQKWVTSWRAKWLDPRHNKSGMHGERKTNMTEFERELEDVVN